MARQSVETSYLSIDPLFIHMFAPPADACFGDSAAPIIMKRHWRQDLAIAIISSPEDPFAPPCTGTNIHYRLDTESAVRFTWEVILDVEWNRRHRRHRR